MIKKSNFVKYAIIFLLSSAFGGCTYLNSTGFCFSSGKYLTDAEYIEAVVRKNISSINIERSDESIKNFYAKNPDCCSVDRTSHMTSSWLENLLGFYYVEVEINYERNSKKITEGRTRFYKKYVHVNACGRTGDEMGEGTKTLETAR